MAGQRNKKGQILIYTSIRHGAVLAFCIIGNIDLKSIKKADDTEGVCIGFFFMQKLERCLLNLSNFAHKNP